MTKSKPGEDQPCPDDSFPLKGGLSWEEIGPWFLGHEALDKLAEQDDSRGAYSGA